jgi:hypothetical protein
MPSVGLREETNLCSIFEFPCAMITRNVLKIDPSHSLIVKKCH